jgi:choline dehydrogenase-like flavoprotein
MISDINDLGPTDALSCDICVIGSGAAGITIAREFIGTPHSLILLEGGGQSFEPASQDPYLSELRGLKHDGIHAGRVRVLGGTTTLWPGQSLPLFDVDFAKRSWVPESGWPLDQKTLWPFYQRAEDVLGLPHATYNAADLSDRPNGVPTYRSQDILTYFSQFAPVPNFAQKYRGDLESAANIKLLTHANAVELRANPNASAVDEVRVRSFQGKELIVRAKIFIVCCGGIETVRLLLVSDSVEKTGIGNRFDVVGRYFQDHPGIAIPVRPIDRARLNRWFGDFRAGGIRHCIKFAASPEFQQSQQILHVGGEVFYPGSFVKTAASLVLGVFRDPAARRHIGKSLLTVARRLHTVAKTSFFRRYVVANPLSIIKSQAHVGFAVEQAPNPQSRVTLSQQTDGLGMRRSAFDWKLTELEGRSIFVFAKTLAEEWKQLGLAEFNPDDLQVSGRQRGEHGGFIDASHHMGTARMGTDPKTSVVDPTCRVHGYGNLYVGSSSVFPTSGFSNPTLTIMALCLRMADQVKAELAK